jgi:DNA-binding NarL/FixJ family response regulator
LCRLRADTGTGAHTTPAGWLAPQTALTGLSGAAATRYDHRAMATIRVALAEDHVLLREGLTRLIAASADLDLVGVAGDLPGLLAVVAEQVPDVVVTDIRMPPTGTDEGIQAAAWIRKHHPRIGVVVLSQYTAPAYAVTLLEHGSAGRAYLLKERVGGADELVRAIGEVAGGGSVIDPLVVDELVRARAQEQRSGLSLLTPRETEILAEMAQGKSNAAIAAALFITGRAVEKHTNSIFTKLGLSEEKDVNRRVKAVLVYLSQRSG